MGSGKWRLPSLQQVFHCLPSLLLRPWHYSLPSLPSLLLSPLCYSLPSLPSLLMSPLPYSPPPWLLMVASSLVALLLAVAANMLPPCICQCGLHFAMHLGQTLELVHSHH
jgi:hypothetical protein